MTNEEQAAFNEMYAALDLMKQHWHHMLGTTSSANFHNLNGMAETALRAATPFLNKE